MRIPDQLLQALDPPAGGWERLIHRRDRESWLIPVSALTCAVTIVVLALPWSHRHHIELKLNGARLLDEPSQGITLRMLDDRQIVALPSGNPNVKLYWINGREVQRSK